jgi:hypothetical protein
MWASLSTWATAAAAYTAGAQPASQSNAAGVVRTTKLAASYEALITGTPTSSIALAAGLASPDVVLSDRWTCPPFWDEHLLLKARPVALVHLCLAA